MLLSLGNFVCQMFKFRICYSFPAKLTQTQNLFFLEKILTNVFAEFFLMRSLRIPQGFLWLVLSNNRGGKEGEKRVCQAAILRFKTNWKNHSLKQLLLNTGRVTYFFSKSDILILLAQFTLLWYIIALEYKNVMSCFF